MLCHTSWHAHLQMSPEMASSRRATTDYLAAALPGAAHAATVATVAEVVTSQDQGNEGLLLCGLGHNHPLRQTGRAADTEGLQGTAFTAGGGPQGVEEEEEGGEGERAPPLSNTPSTPARLR
jgi:hypothetical protein